MKKCISAATAVLLSITSGLAVAALPCSSTDELGILSCQTEDYLASYLWSDKHEPIEDDVVASYLWSDNHGPVEEITVSSYLWSD